MAFTAPTTRATDYLVTAAVWNAEHVDNFNTAVMHLVVRKTADENDSSSTPQNDDALLLALGANEIWRFRFDILVVSGSAVDFRVAFNAPTGANLACIGWNVTTSTLTGNSFASTTFPTTSRVFPTTGTVSDLVIAEGIVVNSTTAGNLNLQWSNDAAGTATVKANSTLWAVKLA